MREGWEYKPVSETCKVVNGGTPRTGIPEYWDGPYQWVTPAEMGGRLSPFMGQTSRTLTEDGLRNSSARLLPPYSVILSSRAPIGHLVINTEPMATNQGCKGLVPKQSMNYMFLYYFLLSSVDLLNDLGTGATFKELSGSKLRDVLIPLPPLPEQQRIVRILDEAFESIAKARANAEKNLRNAREVFESHLNNVFIERSMGWKQNLLIELCESSRVITYGVIKLGDDTPCGVPCLRTSNVRWLRIDTEGMKRIAPELSAEYSRTILSGGEVLVNVRGTLGGVAVASTEMAGWNVSREVAVVPIDPKRINPAFVSYFIGSEICQRWLGGMKRGVAYVGINIEDLRLLPVYTPSIIEQQNIVMHLDSLSAETRRLAAIYERRLAALGAFKKSLLHQAFSGEL